MGLAEGAEVFRGVAAAEGDRVDVVQVDEGAAGAAAA